MEQINRFAIKIIQDILTLKEYKSREEVLHAGQVMLDIANKSDKVSESLKENYIEAYKHLDSFTFEDMQKIIAALKEDDEEGEAPQENE